MGITTYPDGTKIYSAWFTKSCGLAFHVQVRARDRTDAEDKIYTRHPDAYRLISEPDEIDQEILDLKGMSVNTRHAGARDPTAEGEPSSYIVNYVMVPKQVVIMVRL